MKRPSREQMEPDGSERTCVGCGRAFPKERLIRLVLSPEGTVEVDYGARLPGRGAYLFPHRDCFEAAQKQKGLFHRSLRAERIAFEPERLWEVLVSMNRRRLMEDLSLAAKAGGVVSGGNTVEMELDTGNVRLVLLAEDASDNSLDRFLSRSRARGIPAIRALTMEELGRVLHKPPRAVVAITHPAFALKMEKDGAIYDAIAGREQCPARAEER